MEHIASCAASYYTNKYIKKVFKKLNLRTRRLIASGFIF